MLTTSSYFFSYPDFSYPYSFSFSFRDTPPPAPVQRMNQ